MACRIGKRWYFCIRNREQRHRRKEGRRERERRSLHSGRGKPERDKGVARAPSAQKGLGRKAAKGVEKKVGQPLGSFRIKPTFAARKRESGGR